METKIGQTSLSAGVESIGQIALKVRDLQRAKRFFGEVLELQHLFDAEHMAFFACGGVRLMVSAEAAAVPSESTLLYFRVRSLEAAHAALRRRGVAIVDQPRLIAEMADHDLWMMFVKDEEGNVFGLMSEVSRTPVG